MHKYRKNKRGAIVRPYTHIKGGTNMNVYDTVNQLAREIKESEQYLEYKKMKELIKETPELKQKLDDFENARYQTQIATMKGEEPSKEQVETLQKIYLELIQNDTTKKYLDVELKFNTMLSDINKILGETIKDIM